MNKCLACGSEQLSEGKLVSTGVHLFVYGTPMEFKPNESKGKLSIFGTACLNCGHIQMALDQKVLQQYIKK